MKLSKFCQSIHDVLDQTPQHKEISSSKRPSQFSSLNPNSREPPTTILCFILPVLLQVSGRGRSNSLLGRSPAFACAGSPDLLCHRCMWRRNHHPGARVHRIIVFTGLVASISQSSKHRCCLCCFSAVWKSSVSSRSAGPGKTCGLLTSPRSFITPAAYPAPVHASCKGRPMLVAPDRGPEATAEPDPQNSILPWKELMLGLGLSSAREHCWGHHSVPTATKTNSQ